MLERLNEEIRRRTYVVRSFPDAQSCLRLVRALAKVHLAAISPSEACFPLLLRPDVALPEIAPDATNSIDLCAKRPV
jgi:hypothetical protein